MLLVGLLVSGRSGRLRLKPGLGVAVPAAGLLVLCLALLSGCRESTGGSAAAEQPPPLDVRTLMLEPQHATSRISIVGTYFGAADVTVSSELTGLLRHCAVDIGDSCRPGDLLARIDPDTYRLALEQAEGALAEVLARLGRERLPLDDLDIEQLATVQRARAELDFARFDLERLRGLRGSASGSIVTERELSDAETLTRVKEANLRAALEEARALVALATQRDMAVALARWRLERCTVLAPEVPSTAASLAGLAAADLAARHEPPGSDPAAGEGDPQPVHQQQQDESRNRGLSPASGLVSADPSPAEAARAAAPQHRLAAAQAPEHPPGAGSPAANAADAGKGARAGVQQEVRSAHGQDPPPAVGLEDGSDPLWHVAERLVTEGQYVSAGDPLYRLVIANPLKLVAGVPERYAGQIRLGQEVQAEGSAPGEWFTGRISRIQPTVDPQTRTFNIEVLVANQHGRLKAGSFGKGFVLVENPETMVLVPQSALLHFAGVTKAFVVENGVARERVLELGERFGDAFEVKAGLAAGDMLIDAPPFELIDGRPVRLRPSEAAALSGPASP